ncbi:hypothetical protein ACQP25_03345 [Microtetraspora malaysiensis]|uniref:hypothetical protein n=1 Tax=Microtetraspora malaysiensis TaxID=161358 RepID=UPI003D915833
MTVTAVLYLAFSMVDRVLWVFLDTDNGRMALVYGTAAHVVNPDKRLQHGYGGDGGLLKTTYTMTGEPRRAGPSEGETEYHIVYSRFGTVRAPSLDGPSGRLAAAIASVEADPGVDREAAEKARKTIDGLPQTLDAVAVVEFVHSMSTKQLLAFNRRHEICGGADISYIYSPSFYDDSADPASLNAVVWNRYMIEDPIPTELTYQCDTEPEAALAEFRRWVGLLDEGDDLDEFELDYAWLTDTAKEGVVHGLVVDRWELADLRKLLDDPEVRTVQLADVAFDIGAIG